MRNIERSRVLHREITDSPGGVSPLNTLGRFLTARAPDCEAEPDALNLQFTPRCLDDSKDLTAFRVPPTIEDCELES